MKLRQHLGCPVVFALAVVFAAAPALALSLDLKGSLGEAGGLKHYVEPVSNLFNETPYITTEARPMWIHQEIPRHFVTGGGDIDVVAMQLRVAITDRLGFIANKDGWADVDWKAGLDDDSGFANLAFGLKYAFWTQPETNSIVTASLRYEAPTGSIKTSGIRAQGQGDGLFDLFLAGATTFGPIGLEANVGTELAVDTDADTSILHYAFHIDYDVLERVYPLFEVNGFTPIMDGNRTAVGVNGLDLVNLGSSNAKTVVTVAPGVRVRILDNLDWGMAYEIPLTRANDLMDWRLTTDFVIHL